jgi:hypothetical protein
VREVVRSLFYLSFVAVFLLVAFLAPICDSVVISYPNPILRANSLSIAMWS